MAFERFVPPRKQKPFMVSIKRTGTLSFDKAVVEAFGLSAASHVALFFDIGRKLIGIRPAEPKEEGALKLSHRARVSSVRARIFFDTYAIALEQTRRFTVARDDAEGLIVVDISDVKRKPGRRKGTASKPAKPAQNPATKTKK